MRLAVDHTEIITQTQIGNRSKGIKVDEERRDQSQEHSSVRDYNLDWDKTMRTGPQRSMWNRDQVTLYTIRILRR